MGGLPTRGFNEARNRFGQSVEEFEIQFIDGDEINGGLFEALDVHQASIIAFMTAIYEWSENQKLSVIFAVGESGYAFNLCIDDPDSIDVDIYSNMTLRELAAQFVDDGLFGDVPERLAHYINYDAISRDLAFDYTQSTIAGVSYVYRCN